MRIFGIMKQFFLVSMINMMSSKSTMLFELASDALQVASQLVVYLVICDATMGLSGWNFYELMMLNGTAVFMFGVAAMFAHSFAYDVIESLKDGTFDMILVAPLNAVFHILLISFDPWWMPEVLVGLSLVIFSIWKLGVSITLGGVLIYFLFMVMSLLVVFGFSAMVAGLAFRFYGIADVLDIIFYIKNFVKYPLDIYEKRIVLFLSFVFPIAVVNYYPVSYVLGKISDPLLLLLLSASSFAFAFIGYISIKLGLRRYSSAGG